MSTPATSSIAIFDRCLGARPKPGAPCASLTQRERDGFCLDLLDPVQIQK